MLYEELTRRIIGCAMEVHRRLGNGFQACLPKGSTARRQEVMASTPLSHRLPGADSTFEIIRYEKLYEAHMYILECADGSLYTGSTTNLELRTEEHQNGQGANHTKKRL
jgi:hypothetical protein